MAPNMTGNKQPKGKDQTTTSYFEPKADSTVHFQRPTISERSFVRRVDQPISSSRDGGTHSGFEAAVRKTLCETLSEERLRKEREQASVAGGSKA